MKSYRIIKITAIILLVAVAFLNCLHESSRCIRTMRLKQLAKAYTG